MKKSKKYSPLFRIPTLTKWPTAKAPMDEKLALSPEDAARTIVIEAKDGARVETTAGAASMSVFAANQLQNSLEQGDDEITLFTPLVTKEDLEVILEWCAYHYSHEPSKIKQPLPGPLVPPLITDWEHAYLEKFKVDESPETIKRLLNAANYMFIDPLIDLFAAKLGSKVRCMNPAEIYAYFRVEPPTKEEMNDLVKQHPWLKEEEEDEEEENELPPQPEAAVVGGPVSES